MKRRLFYLVKYIRWIYSLYYYLGTFALKILRVFIIPDPRLLLFVSFGGRKFNDSPKAIYESMLCDRRFDDFRIVWAFTNPDEYEIPCGNKVKIDTFRYFVIALRARAWITNSSIERGLSFKGKNTFYFNTWHGTPLKKMGIDMVRSSKSFRGNLKMQYDLFTVQGDYEAEIFKRCFNLPDCIIYKIGLPRNDRLAIYSEIERQTLRTNLKLSSDKKVVLYVPTFREYDQSDAGEVICSIPMDIAKWENELSNDYVILFRAHYEVARMMGIKFNDFIRNVSEYPCLEDLMIVSDILVSDYSSVFFDYSITHKPMLCYAYDYEKYNSERGLYFDVREYLPTAITENDLIEKVKLVDCTKASYDTKRFQETFVTVYGSATKHSLDLIYSFISNTN